MAELLVRTHDKESDGDPFKDRHRSGAGCVIAIMPDGHKWSEAEQSAPYWRIVKVPGVGAELLSQFTSPDVGYLDTEAEKASRVLRRWASRLDLAALDALLADKAKEAEMKAAPAKALQYFQALRAESPVLIDPNVFGDQDTTVKVFG